MTKMIKHRTLTIGISPYMAFVEHTKLSGVTASPSAQPARVWFGSLERMISWFKEHDEAYIKEFLLDYLTEPKDRT